MKRHNPTMKNQKAKHQMKLGVFLVSSGHHIAAWRHSSACINGGVNFAHYSKVAKIAERGKFDMLFLSDSVGVRTYYKDNDELSRWGYVTYFEPLTVLASLATITKNLGLVATASTTYNEPFHIARKFASIDIISNGRVGWNVVTSGTDAEAQNMNLKKQPQHKARYQRAREFMQVATGLWDSWADDAFLFDRLSGRYFDPKKLHILNHKGDFFRVKGPLNIPRPIQGYPVIVQAGSSVDGQDFAARWAEVVFTAQNNIEQAKEFYKNIKSQVVSYKRNPEDIKIMPGIFPVIGKTLTEAKEKYDALQELIDPKVGLGLLSGLLGDMIDLSKLSLDDPIPELSITNGNTSRQHLICEKARNEGLTLRELYKEIAGSRGHKMMFGTPTDIADQLEEWFLGGAADGFNIMPPCLPSALEEFVNFVVPELQKRNLFRKKYEGLTLRDNLGLPRPKNQFFDKK